MPAINSDTISTALTNLTPGAGWMLDGDRLAGLTWLDEDIERPMDTEIIKEIELIEKERQATEYTRDREAAYNAEGCDIRALIVAIWEKLIEDKPEAAAAIQTKREEIKERFPKPEEV